MRSVVISGFCALFVTILTSVFVLPASAQDSGLGRHKRLYAVPAPGPVVIDGQLQDWDLSGQIEMFVISDGKDTQGAKFALMYDQEALYLSGVVRDTSPMMNRQDPKVRGNRGWDADSCQFRLTIDPSQSYPIKESTFKYKDAKAPAADTRDDIKHLTLWYYTDRDEPCLVMQNGMTYRTPRIEWAPHGVVPSDLYQAKYRRSEDGRGYTFEYRIPWTTFDARQPLRGGDLVAGTVQFNWGLADGLKTAGGAAWAYDVMSGPGFAFQNAEVWGKIIFAPQGNVTKELVEAGVPKTKPQPLQFEYELPRDGQVTLQLVDEQNFVRRILLAQADRPRGKHTQSWDGLDDQGKPLTVGTYKLRGIIHEPITSRFLFSVHNSGQPPYPTDNGKGGWGGDHGNPTACAALPDGMLLSWDGCEYGWGIIKVDLQGRKQWGSKSAAKLLATDGERFFTYDPHGFQAAAGIQVFDVADGRPLNWGNGTNMLLPPAAQATSKDTHTDEVTGLAYGQGRVYASYQARNLVVVFDATRGDIVSTWNVPAPQAMAVSPDGILYVISQGTLMSVLKDGKLAPLTKISANDLDTPSGIAVASDGTVFVSNQGKQQDIAVLDRQGKLLRRIGKAGGRPAMGKYDPHGVFCANGLAVDVNGNLWVAESADGPKRISVWNASSGAFEREYFGGSDYFAYAHINPAVPDEIYCHNVLWRIDWQTCTVTPVSTIWRATAPDMMPEPGPSAYPRGFYYLTAQNGKQFGIGTTKGDRRHVLYRREGDIFKPLFASFSLNRSSKIFQSLGSPELDDPKNTPDGWYFWQDANDDQRVQLSELYRVPDKNARLGLKTIAPDMTVWLDGGSVLKPVSWQSNGQPVYDPRKLEPTFLTGTPHAGPASYLWLDPDGSVYTHTPGQRPSLARWSSSGKMEWGYPNVVRWHDALGLPVIRPGRIHGMTGGLGVAGPFTGNMSYFGVCHLFRNDGQYVAAVMKDGRTGTGLGPEEGQPEGQGGSLVRVVTQPGQPARTLLLGAGQDGRVTEVLGLDAIQSLPEREFVLTPEQMSLATEKLSEYLASTGAATRLVLRPGRESLQAVAPVTRVFDGSREFSARAAYDRTSLYVSFDVTSPSELINAITDPTLLFKGGNCLDIQLATDAKADPQRPKPVPGDVRLLVTRKNGSDGKPKPFAMLLRPKVENFTGQPTVLRSPTGSESFDQISVVPNIGLEYRPTPNGYTAVVTIPLDVLGLKLQPGQALRMDLGVLYGNATGSQITARSYLSNRSFTANVINDVPHESRLEPSQWGEAVVE